MKSLNSIFIPISLGLSIAYSTIASAYDLIPLWESRHVSTTATFYTTYYNDHRSALAVDGHEEHGVVAWVPCSNDVLNGPNGEISYKGSASYPDIPSGDWITPSRFRHGYSAAMDFPCAQPSGTLPLYSMYKWTPETDFIYTTSVSEFNSKKALGYVFGRVEGYIFSSQVSGSVPLYRLSIGVNTPNADAEHRYVVSASAKQSLLNAGWTDEGIAGYVFSSYVNSTVNATQYTGTFNGFNVSPTTTTAIPIKNVVPYNGVTTFGGNSTTVQYGTYASNTTVRPVGAVWQYMTFQIYTADIFSPGSSLNHAPFYLHYASTAGRTQMSGIPPYDGIGVALVPGNTLNGVSCSGAPTGGGQVFFEIGEAKAVSCAANVLQPLQKNTKYTFTYYLDDAANVVLTIRNDALGTYLQFLDGSTTFSKSFLSLYSCPLNPPYGTLPANKTYCANAYSANGYPLNNTGYMALPLFLGSSNINSYIANMHVGWANSSFVALN